MPMKFAIIAVGLLLYAVSLILPVGQWYISFLAGVVTGLGIVRAIVSFSSQDRRLAMRRYSSDSDVEAATQRVLQALEKDGPGRLIRLDRSVAKIGMDHERTSGRSRSPT